MYVKDSTSGTTYIADIQNATEALIKANGGTTTVAYSETDITTFTYTVEGSNITLTATDSDGETSTLTGTIVDENTIRITDNSDEEPFEYNLKKADAAPTEATVTVEVTAAPSMKTATIAYDGSSAENAPDATGDDGVFSSVQAEIEGAGVAKGYSLDDGYPKYGSQTYSGDDGVKNGTTSAGMLIVSSLKDGNTKITFDAGTVMAYATYKFTLSEKSDVETAVKAFNTQSSALAGKIEIIDAEGNSKASKQADAGSKSANDVTADSVELDAGVYTLKFSWVLTKAAQLKKVNCGISSFSIKATTK